MRRALNPEQILEALAGLERRREVAAQFGGVSSDYLRDMELLEGIYQVALQLALLREKLGAPES